MSVTEEIVGPKMKIGSYMEPIIDKPRIDLLVSKYFNAIWQYQVDIARAGGPVDILDNGPTFADLRDTVNDNGFAYDDLVALSDEVTSMNLYLDEAEGADFPVNFPASMMWMNVLTVKEKKELTKSQWRTRNFHGLVPGWLACYSLVIIFAGAEIYATMAGKFMKIERQVYPDSKLQIPYNGLKPETYLAQHYRANFPLDEVYLTIQLDMLIDNIYNSWDALKYIIPEESVKIGGMLFGQFKNFVLDNDFKIDYDYPVDFVFTCTGFDDNVFGDDYTTVIEPLLVKIRDLCENLYSIAESVEYGDKFYSGTFSDFKQLLTPVSFDSNLLTQFGALPIPWPHIFMGLHHGDVSGDEEFIARAWDENEVQTMDISDDSGNQVANFFIRRLEGKLLEADVLDAANPVQYIYSIIPYGYDEESWRKALVFGWAWMTQFMGGMDLNTTLPYGDNDDLLSHFSYAEYYDSDDNLKSVQAIDDDVELAEDVLLGMFGTGDHHPMNDAFKPRLVNSRGYEDLVDVKLGHAIADDNAITLAGKMEADYLENLQRLLGYIANQQPEFDWQHTRDWFLKCINPVIAPPQKQSDSVQKDVVTSEPEDVTKPNSDEQQAIKKAMEKKGDPTQPTDTPSGPPEKKTVSKSENVDTSKKTAEANVKKPDKDISEASLEEVVKTHVQTE
jgi:hypothetical protein